MDTLPLPPRPDIEQYRKRAKTLVAAANSGDADAVKHWASDWLTALTKLLDVEINDFVRGSFDRAIERFSVSNPEIAEAVLVTGDQVVVNGKAFGQINFIAWEKGTGRFLVFDVYVRTNLSLIDSQIHALFPKDDIRLSQANGSVVMSGSASDPKIATAAEAVVQAAGFKTVNLLESPVKDSTQVQLMVRVAEVSRNRMRELGTSYAYQASPGSGGRRPPAASRWFSCRPL